MPDMMLPDMMLVVACLSQCLDPTTLRQLSRVIEAMLAMTGRVTMRVCHQVVQQIKDLGLQGYDRSTPPEAGIHRVETEGLKEPLWCYRHRTPLCRLALFTKNCAVPYEGTGSV